MTRILLRALTITALAGTVAGCGSRVDASAQDAGQAIGAAVAGVGARSSAQDARRQLSVIREQVRAISDELPAADAEQLQVIANDLRAQVQAAGSDATSLRHAFATARAQFEQVGAASGSPLDELRRAVRDGYDDALGQ